MPPAPAKTTFFDFSALAFGAWSAAQIVFCVRHIYLTDSQVFGALLMLVLGPAVIAGLILLVQYRKDVRRNPLATVAALFTLFSVLYTAALPQIFEEHGFFKEHWILGWKFYLACVGAIVLVHSRVIRFIDRYYESVLRALRALFGAFIPEKLPDVRNAEPASRIARPPVAGAPRPPAPVQSPRKPPPRNS